MTQRWYMITKCDLYQFYLKKVTHVKKYESSHMVAYIIYSGIKFLFET